MSKDDNSFRMRARFDKRKENGLSIEICTVIVFNEKSYSFHLGTFQYYYIIYIIRGVIICFFVKANSIRKRDEKR